MNKTSLRSAFSDDPEMLRLIEAREQSALLKEILATSLVKDRLYETKEVKVEFLKGEKGDTPTKGELLTLIEPLIPAPLKGKDGRTPVKGMDYFDGKDGHTPTRKELVSLIEPLLPSVVEANMPEPMAPIHTTQVIKEELTVTEQLVKDIIKVMHTLPETDKLEVSKGIRNASSFIFNGTRYRTEELMHGGGSSSGGGSTVVTQYSLTGVQVGSDVVVALSQLTHFATLQNVIAAYRNQIPQTDGVTCTITATNVTYLNADAGEVFSITYSYT